MNDNWEDIARQYANDVAFWRGLVMDIGRAVGGPVYIQDDGGRVDEPLALKVPDAVKLLLDDLNEARRLTNWAEDLMSVDGTLCIPPEKQGNGDAWMAALDYWRRSTKPADRPCEPPNPES